MSTITRERIAELANFKPSGANSVNSATREEWQALARIALASLEAEAVAWTDEQELRDVEKFGCAYLFTVNPITPNADPRRVIKLYTAPPAPASVPDIKWPEDKFCPAEYAGSQLWEETEIWNKAIDACKAAFRAAMLQGADGNSPVIHGDWVACSERMPEVVPAEIIQRINVKGAFAIGIERYGDAMLKLAKKEDSDG